MPSSATCGSYMTINPEPQVEEANNFANFSLVDQNLYENDAGSAAIIKPKFQIKKFYHKPPKVEGRCLKQGHIMQWIPELDDKYSSKSNNEIKCSFCEGLILSKFYRCNKCKMVEGGLSSQNYCWKCYKYVERETNNSSWLTVAQKQYRKEPHYKSPMAANIGLVPIYAVLGLVEGQPSTYLIREF
jgi:hypothetical protein